MSAVNVGEILEHQLNANLLSMPHDVYEQLFNSIAALGDENEKLRELARNLYACINNRDCDCCEYADEACEFERNMRELGVEV